MPSAGIGGLILGVAGASVLLVAGIVVAFGQPRWLPRIGLAPDRMALATFLARLAAMLQGVALIWQSVVAQWAWGSYWSWDPVECWRLVPLLANAILLTIVGQRGWSGRLPRVLVWVAALLGVAVWIGTESLLGWLGLSSMYRMG